MIYTFPYPVKGDRRYIPPCEEGDVCCPERHGNYLCTRKLGHSGHHAAHGLQDQMFARWPQEKKS